MMGFDVWGQSPDRSGSFFLAQYRACVMKFEDKSGRIGAHGPIHSGLGYKSQIASK